MTPTLAEVAEQVARFAPGAPNEMSLDADLVRDLGYDPVRPATPCLVTYDLM